MKKMAALLTLLMVVFLMPTAYADIQTHYNGNPNYLSSAIFLLTMTKSRSDAGKLPVISFS